jgi:hypothetical protein
LVYGQEKDSGKQEFLHVINIHPLLRMCQHVNT